MKKFGLALLVSLVFVSGCGKEDVVGEDPVDNTGVTPSELKCTMVTDTFEETDDYILIDTEQKDEFTNGVIVKRTVSVDMEYRNVAAYQSEKDASDLITEEEMAEYTWFTFEQEWDDEKLTSSIISIEVLSEVPEAAREQLLPTTYNDIKQYMLAYGFTCDDVAKAEFLPTLANINTAEDYVELSAAADYVYEGVTVSNVTVEENILTYDTVGDMTAEPISKLVIEISNEDKDILGYFKVYKAELPEELEADLSTNYLIGEVNSAMYYRFIELK